MSKKIEDRTFADSGADAFVKAETPTLTPEKFDFAAWVAGATPIRKSVTIYADGQVQAEIDVLKQREAMLPAGDERESVRAHLVELYRRVQASAATFVLEGRTSEWVQQKAKELKKADIPDDIAGLHIAAAQIISPDGVTADGLHALAQVNEQAVNELMRAAVEVNTRPIGLDPRFLPGASA